MPETPKEKLNNLIKQHKIEKKDAEILANNFELVELFEQIIKKVPAKFALPWVTGELLRVLNYNKKNLEEVNISPEHFIQLLKLVQENKLTELKAKQILNKFVPSSFSPIEEAKSSEKITDKKELEKIIDNVIKSNSKPVQDFKSGEKNALNFLMGEIMKLSSRRADYKLSLEILKEKLK